MGHIYLSEKSFHENLEISNVLISYSSTTLEESLLSHKPVIIYDKWNRYNHMSDIINKNFYEINYFNNVQDMSAKLKIIYKVQIILIKIMYKLFILPIFLLISLGNVSMLPYV